MRTLLDTPQQNSGVSSSSSDESGLDNYQLPSYYAGVDNHNYPTDSFAFTNPATWGKATTDAGKFLIDSVYSGLNSFYNTGVAVGNFFGADLKENDTAEGLSKLDSDLGAYYQEHSQYIDAAGFALGSLIPGTLGVKALNMGQKVLGAAVRSGKIGGNLGKALGLLKPADEFATAAGKEMAAAQASFTNLNKNTLAALATGYGQNVLEVAAFQTAAAATMFKSPILDQADGWDITKDIVLGSLEFGAIGGVLSGIKSVSKIRGIVKKEGDLPEKAFTLTTSLHSSAPASDKIIASVEDYYNTPSVAATLTGGESETMIRKLEDLRTRRLSGLNGQMRAGIHELTAGDDAEFSNQVADLMTGLPKEQVEASLKFATQVGRLGSKLGIESQIAKNEKSAASLLPEYGSSPLSVQYVKLTGEDAGAVITDFPNAPGLADLSRNANEVKAKIAGYGFKEKTLWNPIKEVTGVNPLEAEARYWWARNVAKTKNEMTVYEWDIPLQEKIYQDWIAQRAKLGTNLEAGAEKLQKINVVSENGGTYEVTNPDDLLRGLRQSKLEVGSYLQKSKAAGNSSITLDHISKITNTRISWLNGEQSTNEARDIFAHQSYQEEYNAQLVKNGIRKPTDTPIDLTLQPTWMKVGVDYKPLADTTGHELAGAAYLDAKLKLTRQAITNVVTKAFGQDAERLVPITRQHILNSNRFGAGPKGLLSANGQYGSIESTTEQIGSVAADLLNKGDKQVTDALDSSLNKLAQKSEVAIEYSALQNKVHSTAEHYALDETGTKLIPRSLKEYTDRIAAGEKNLTRPELQPGAPEYIDIHNPETAEVIQNQIKLNSSDLETEKELRAAQGLESNKDPNTWYPPRPLPKDYPHFAIVVDNSVAGGSVGQKSMLHAADAKTLEGMIDKVNKLGPRYTTYTKNDLERFFKEHGEFEYEKTLHENYIDAELRKTGVNNQFFPQTDPQKIARDILNHHLRGKQILTRELINAHYEPEFTTLRKLGDQYTNIATSVYSNSYRFAENAVNNPYVNYIKTALNIKQTSEYPIWNSVNQLADSLYSRAHYAISEAFNGLKSPSELDQINDLLQKYGVKSGYQDAATMLLANHSAPKGALGNFVRRANSILSTLTLGLDPLNALNNAIGANVLLGSETKNLIKRIQQGNTEAAGELARLKGINLLGTDADITSASKLIAKSYQRFFNRDANPGLDEFYAANGWLPKSISEIRAIHSELELVGNETVAQLDSKIKTAFSKAKQFSEWGYKKSGNLYAETMNRWVAADVMKQISDIGIKHGIISGQEQLSYINTFVNRTQGNFLASQRPIYFQGPIGNAVGLFQTYQFNLMQQLFRYVGEGTAKDAGMLLGLQSTLYGLNGLPAFNYMNTHIVGTMSSNPAHTDAYSTLYGALGKNVGNWLVYGLPSNLLQTNIYSRGDINPRQATVIPTNPADIPIVNATAGFFGNIKNMLGRLNDGGSTWETILQGIEHNGLSRPLAGMAQVAQGISASGQAFATSKQGTILGSNDLFSVASLSRLAGGRPLDEAIVNDAAFRVNAYRAVDYDRKKLLDQAIKTAVIKGEIPSYSQYETFAAKYAELGGDQKRFNQYMMKQIVSANTPQAEKIMQQLKSPYAQNMQKIMGGRDLFDQ